MFRSMVEQQSVRLRKLGGGRAGEVRFGRFLANPRVSRLNLVESVCSGIETRCAGRHVLAIQDTTEINYRSHARRVSGLGTVGNGTDPGFFLHPLLVVDAVEHSCLGLAHLHLWQRFGGKAKNYKKLPIDEKESHRWIQTVEAGHKHLQQAEKITVIADREADIYELWCRLPNARTELLIRACRDRCLETASGVTLFEWIKQQPVKGSYTVMLPAIEGRRSRHEARLQLRVSVHGSINSPRTDIKLDQYILQHQ